MKLNANHNASRAVRKALAASSILFVFSGLATDFGNNSQANAFEIRVRAKSQLTVDVVTAGTSLQIYGNLRDDLQQPLPQRQVVVHITPANAAAPIEQDAVKQDTAEQDTAEQDTVEQGTSLEHVLLTDRRGQFELTEELAPDFYHVAVEFSETEHLDPAVSLHDVEIKSHPVELSVRAPKYVHTKTKPVLLAVHALVQQSGLSADVKIQSDQTNVGTIHLDHFGRGSLDVREMLESGVNSFEALLPPGSYRDAVQKPLTIRLGNELKLQAQANKVLERLVRGVSIAGSVHDETGAVPNLQVRVTLKLAVDTAAQDPAEPLSIERSTESDADGMFHVFIPNSVLPDGSWNVQADVAPDVGPTVSQTLETIVLDRTLSRKILQSSIAVVALALLLLILQRLAVLLKARRRARKKRIDTKTALDDVLRDHETIQITPITNEFESFGDANADDTFAQTSTSQTIAGITWDIWQKKPIAGATLIFRHAKSPETDYRTVRSDAKGRFLIENIQPEPYILSVHAAGFIPAKLAFDIPHNGTLSRFRLDLIAVPLKIRQIYQTTIQSIQGEDLWGKQTPRQINELITRTLALETAQSPQLHERLLAAQDNPAEVLRALTEIVEESYFSGRQYNEELWNIARELAQEIIRFAQQYNANRESK